MQGVGQPSDEGQKGASVSEWASLVIAVAVLLALLLVVGLVGGLRQNGDTVVVVARAIVQLSVVGFVIRAVILRPALAPLYLVLMLCVAAYTSSRRLRCVRIAFPSAVAAIGAGTAVTTAVVVLTGALPRDARDLVPFAAQIIGGAMTATTLAALRMRDDVLGEWELVEAMLAIGASSRQAVADVARRAAAKALVPALDQTRNVGLVVLPGAYVGLLLGGASPAEAGRVQLLVLIGLLVAESLAAVLVTRLLATSFARVKPVGVGASVGRSSWLSWLLPGVRRR
jgi:putative ABC transport system permease protein